MEKPTIEEVLELVSFWRDKYGKLFIRNVHGSVYGSVCGNIEGKVYGKILNK